MTMTTKTQRTAEVRIAELTAKIEGIKARDQRRKAKAKPEVKFALAATKALDKALGATTDATLRTAFQEARTTVAAAIAVEGVTVAATTTGAGKPGRKRKNAA
jgi:hypothetical protein